ncbi:MAG TPA: YdcF family protein [Candidatus Bariatricus faecipullorum]|nr:YdcF family protein [Candidatus Bariatricus faecipullorum]
MLKRKVSISGSRARSAWKFCIRFVFPACTAVLFLILGINFYVVFSTRSRIISAKEAGKLTDADCILILGAGVRADGSPSPMLQDRLDTGIALYQSGVSSRILMSGDHGRKDYNEVQVMKDYSSEKGIPSSRVFMDHAGFSTYDSLYRARDIFQARKVVIISQKYHLHRALYLASQLGLQAYGVPADTRTYRGQGARELREILARNKDFFSGIIQPSPRYLGEPIPLSGDGNLTND